MLNARETTERFRQRRYAIEREVDGFPRRFRKFNFQVVRQSVFPHTFTHHPSAGSAGTTHFPTLACSMALRDVVRTRGRDFHEEGFHTLRNFRFSVRSIHSNSIATFCLRAARCMDSVLNGGQHKGQRCPNSASPPSPSYTLTPSSAVALTFSSKFSCILNCFLDFC